MSSRAVLSCFLQPHWCEAELGAVFPFAFGVDVILVLRASNLNAHSDGRSCAVRGNGRLMGQRALKHSQRPVAQIKVPSLLPVSPPAPCLRPTANSWCLQ